MTGRHVPQLVLAHRFAIPRVPFPDRLELLFDELAVGIVGPRVGTVLALECFVSVDEALRTKTTYAGHAFHPNRPRQIRESIPFARPRKAEMDDDGREEGQ